MITHDATRAATLLREVLVGDRNRVGFFLGAGCPVSIRIEHEESSQPLIPDVAGLTTFALDFLSNANSPLKAKLDSYLKSAGLENANIEVILSQVRAMHEVVGGEFVHGFSAEDLGALNTLICEAIASRVFRDLPTGENGYRHLAYWVKGVARERPVEIFTTNYDLLVEEAFEDVRLSIFDGFTGSRRPFFDVAAIEAGNIPAHWTRLWKLHGSINWRTNGEVVHRVTEIISSECALIHPSERKYDQSRRLPYLALLDQLRVFLRRPSAVLVICGYSFGDQHINEIIIEGLEQNPTAIAIALQYGAIENYTALQKLARRTPGLSAYAEDVAIIGTQPGAWTVPPGVDTAVLNGVFEATSSETEGWKGGSRRLVIGDFSRLGPFLLQVTGVRAPAVA